MQAQICTLEQQVSSATIWRFFSPEDSVTVQLNMSERENGQLPLPKQTAPSRVSSERWEQIKTAYASGIGLREIARNMGIPEGTVLARAKREGWTQQIEAAKQAVALPQSNAITPLQSIAAVMQERGERYRERIAGVSERVVGHIESMRPDEILARGAQFEKIDTIARRTFGLNEAPPAQGALTLSVLTNHAIVQVKASVPAAPSPDK